MNPLEVHSELPYMKEVRGPTQDSLCVINIDPAIVNNEPIPSNTLVTILLFMLSMPYHFLMTQIF
jgi:hypothetical protein